MIYISPGWLEPLLHRIKQDPTVVAVPVVDAINWETFKVSGHIVHSEK